MKRAPGYPRLSSKHASKALARFFPLPNLFFFFCFYSYWLLLKKIFIEGIGSEFWRGAMAFLHGQALFDARLYRYSIHYMGLGHGYIGWPLFNISSFCFLYRPVVLASCIPTYRG